MNIKTLIVTINKKCDEADFIEARRLIDHNLKRLTEHSNYLLLSGNARILVKHIINENNKPESAKITRKDLLIINSINKYATDFDISMLKRQLRSSIELIQNPEVKKLLNSNAKTILESMGAFLIGVKEPV